MARAKHRCRGCRYLGEVAEMGTCDYLIMTGKRRCWPDGTPAKFSKTEPCPCYLADTRKRQRTKMPRGPHPEGEQTDTAAVKKPLGLKGGDEPMMGYRSNWDVEAGKKMYADGHTPNEIAKALDTTPGAVRSCAARYGWRFGSSKEGREDG